MALPRYRAVLSGVRMLASGDRTGWLSWSDSNSEMSPQIIPLKGRADSRDQAEWGPQRLFAFELRRGDTQLGPKLSALLLFYASAQRSVDARAA
jgi:hypothetical protein